MTDRKRLPPRAVKVAGGINGTAATFKALSATEITTAVWADTTTRTVRLATPRGTLLSNVTFQVIR